MIQHIAYFMVWAVHRWMTTVSPNTGRKAFARALCTIDHREDPLGIGEAALHQIGEQILDHGTPTAYPQASQAMPPTRSAVIPCSALSRPSSSGANTIEPHRLE